MSSATDSPGATVAAAPKAPASDDEKARRRAESQERAALMGKLPADVKMRVAQREITLVDALTDAGLEIPEWLRTGASAPPGVSQPPGDVEPSASGRNTQPVAPRTAADAAPPSVSGDAKRAEALRRAALMGKLPSELKLRVAKREITLDDAMREAGIDPE